MKTSVVNGQHFPPYLRDVQAQYPDFVMDLPKDQQMTCPVDANSTCSSYSVNASSDVMLQYYATGSPRLNVHIGHLVWATAFLRLHNSVCDMLARDNPSITDQLVSLQTVLIKEFGCQFQTERLTLENS